LLKHLAAALALGTRNTHLLFNKFWLLQIRGNLQKHWVLTK